LESNNEIIEILNNYYINKWKGQRNLCRIFPMTMI
jgi:hypothetical protein